tara:strand:+ start:18603 stop:19211 length:609 start_codon:yes stop_codon:yes gene_type:complete
MNTSFSSQDILRDIRSMRKFSGQLLGKGKIYDRLLSYLLHDVFPYSDYTLPKLKDLQSALGIPYSKVRKHLNHIYSDLIDHEENGVDLSPSKVEYVFTLKKDEDYTTVVMHNLPVLPKVGEQVTIPYFSAKSGDHFYVNSIHHCFFDGIQTIEIVLRPGLYNKYLDLRKEEAFLKGQISWEDYFNADDYDLRSRLGLPRYLF